MGKKPLAMEETFCLQAPEWYFDDVNDDASQRVFEDLLGQAPTTLMHVETDPVSSLNCSDTAPLEVIPLETNRMRYVVESLLSYLRRAG